MSARVLVTGGAGYIGSHTCKALAQAGFEPVVLDNLVHGHRDAVKWGALIEGDLDNRVLLDKVLREHGVQSVVHFAAYAYVGESMSQPARYFRNNVAGTLCLLEAALDAGVKRFVFSSTCATYGVPHALPISEDHPQAPVNPYGESKLFVEKMLGWFDQAHALRSVSLRYFNAAGADPDGELGERHDPEPHLVPRAIQAAYGRLPHVDVFGTDYPTPDGTAIRDYIHVSDLAAAHVKALQHLNTGGATAALNLGTGRGHSVRKVLSAVERLSGRKVPVRHASRRAGDPPELVADARRAAELLDWRAAHSDLDTIVDTALRWDRREFERAEAA